MLKLAPPTALLPLCLALLAGPAFAAAAKPAGGGGALHRRRAASPAPAAEARIAGLADTHGVIALTFSVDYWDYLGWKDTFARPEFADRQRAYKKFGRSAEVYTPAGGGRRRGPGRPRG